MVYAGINVPFTEELGELILKGVDNLSQYLDLKGLVKQAKDAFNNVKNML
jgi:hypothetical protein